MAMWLRERAAGVAEWICPELNPEGARKPSSARVYMLAFVVAILAAFIIWDASAGADLPGVSASNRAGAAAW